VGIQALSAQVFALETEIGQKLNLNAPVLEQFSTDFSELRKEVLTLEAHISGMCYPLSHQPKTVPTSFNLSNNAARIEKCPCRIEFVLIHYPISLLFSSIRSKLNSFRSDQKRLLRHSGLSFS
jgi:hypothetical protein